MKTKLLISACLCGKNTKYNGKNNAIQLKDLQEFFDFYLVCPEVMGGLPIPRDPSEILNDKVVSIQGKDVTKEYNKGAAKALEIAKTQHIQYAILKEGSPSCGSKEIYDGTFTNHKVKGQGITTKLLCENGIKVWNESEIDNLLATLKQSNRF